MGVLKHPQHPPKSAPATGGRVCLECSFYSFSTDTGCTVELVSSDSSSSVQYTETINKCGNGTAKGCVSLKP